MTAGEVVHACPEGTGGVTGCCGRTPFELDRMSRMTVDPALVTCRHPRAHRAHRGRGGTVSDRHTHFTRDIKPTGVCPACDATRAACADCGKPLGSADEESISGLCLLCLNGPVSDGAR
jgi:hypothetical protein